MSRPVSITLQSSQDGIAIADAIMADNPEATRNAFPAMIKIDAPGRLTIKGDTVSGLLGREWDPQEIHMSVVSLSGSVDEDDGSFTLFWR
jgi:phenol hydroxylase P2 protein